MDIKNEWLDGQKKMDGWLGQGGRWMVGWIVKTVGWMHRKTWMVEWLGK